LQYSVCCFGIINGNDDDDDGGGGDICLLLCLAVFGLLLIFNLLRHMLVILHVELHPDTDFPIGRLGNCLGHQVFSVQCL